jgi:hypothetical protein
MFNFADRDADLRPRPTENPAVEQGALSVVCEVIPGRIRELRQALAAVQAQVDAWRRTGTAAGPFAGAPGIHFARMVVLDGLRGAGGAEQPELVLTTSHDGPLGKHLGVLSERGADALAAIFEHCTGFEPGEPSTAARRVRAYIERRRVKTDAFFVAARRRTVGQVQGEAELFQAIGAFLDATGERRGDVLEPVRAFVASQPRFAWALRAPAPTRLPRTVKAGLLGAWMLNAAPDTMSVLRRVSELRRMESDDARALAERPDDRRTGLGSRYGDLDWPALDRTRKERTDTQNAMSLLLAVKPGDLRLRALARTLAFVDLLGKLNCDDGQLADIRTIHFARWFLLGGQTRLFFESNYDGSWDDYLGAFIERAAWGVTGIWGHTEGFPGTRYMFLDGAKDAQRFKEFTRANQVPTDVWYGAYPGLSAEAIRRNGFVRQGLSVEMTPEQRRAWHRAL